MCLLREPNRSSIGGGGCDGEGEGFALSLGFGAMDFPARESFGYDFLAYQTEERKNKNKGR
jgi:hypothetical protein